jgi:hypothetical protein
MSQGGCMQVVQVQNMRPALGEDCNKSFALAAFLQVFGSRPGKNAKDTFEKCFGAVFFQSDLFYGEPRDFAPAEDPAFDP